jgi:hypothetical protein
MDASIVCLRVAGKSLSLRKFKISVYQNYSSRWIIQNLLAAQMRTKEPYKLLAHFHQL